MATVYDPIAKDESLNTTEATPRNIADVLAEELSGIASALTPTQLNSLADVTISSPSDGQTLKYDAVSQKWVNANDAGGHTIENPSGTDLTQRTNLQFADAHLTDDSVNDRTEIENIKDITSADYASATEDGFYNVTDESDEELTAADIAYDSDYSIKERIDEISASNAGAHNSIYRGKYLGTSVTADQYSAISAGTFNDLYIGDYWTIDGVNWRIAAFDYWLRTGDTECTTHHVVIVPDSSLATAKMNNSSTTTGGYVGSDIYTGNNSNTGLSTAQSTINSAFGSAHILTHRELLSNAVTSNAASGWAWYDSTVELMNETMVYGHEANSEKVAGGSNYNVGIDKTQLPLFAHDPSKITNRADWWFRSVVSSAAFALVLDVGIAGHYSASGSFGVRPAFAIKA